jgi:hypothetical protein
VEVVIWHHAPPPLRRGQPSGSSTHAWMSVQRQPTRRGEMWMRVGKSPRSSIRLRVGSRRRVIFLTNPAKPPPMAGRKQEVRQLRE